MNNGARFRYVIFTNIFLVRLCVGIIWASAGPLLPLMIEEFGISRSTAGWFASIAPLTIALVSLPVNSLVNRLGLNRLFAIGAFLLGMGVFSFFLTDFLSALLFRICFALGTAIIIPVATAITAEWFSNRELPVMNGIGMSAANVGNGIAFLVTVPIAGWLSWNAPIVIYAAFALVCAVCWVFIGREKKTSPEQESPEKMPEVLDDRPDLPLKKILTNKVAILMTLNVTLSWALANGINAWLPDYYFTAFGIPLNTASSILSIYTISATVSSIAGGILSTRFGRRKPFIIISGIFTGLAALCAVLFNIPALIYLSVTLFGIFFGIQISSTFTIPMEMPGMSVRSGVIVLSMMQVGGNFGNFVSPLVTGAIYDATGSYLPGFIVFIILSFGLLAAGILIPETGPAARKTT